MEAGLRVGDIDCTVIQSSNCKIDTFKQEVSFHLNVG